MKSGKKYPLILFPGHVLVFASLSREGLRSSESAVHCGLTGQRTSKERYVRRPRIKKKAFALLNANKQNKQIPNGDLQKTKTNICSTQYLSISEVATLFMIF